MIYGFSIDTEYGTEFGAVDAINEDYARLQVLEFFDSTAPVCIQPLADLLHDQYQCLATFGSGL